MLQPHPRDGAARDHARRALSPPVLEKAGCCEEHYERGFREVARGSDMMSPGLWPRWRIICGIRLRDGAQAEQAASERALR